VVRIGFCLALVSLGLTLTGCGGGEREGNRSATIARGIGTGQPESVSDRSGTCPMTLPNRTVAPGAGFTVAGFNYGNLDLRAHLFWRRGTLTAGVMPDGGAMAIINEDGSISAKLGWWRGVPGKLVISGRRLDIAALPLRADVPAGYGPLGFQPSGLTFPTVGCWQVVGKVGDASLAFVVRVTKVGSGD
jgi:hypothetical protein